MHLYEKNECIIFLEKLLSIGESWTLYIWLVLLVSLVVMLIKSIILSSLPTILATILCYLLLCYMLALDHFHSSSHSLPLSATALA